jgi:hypothetical protein
LSLKLVHDEVTDIRSYADIVNSKYSDAESQYVSMADRWQDAVDSIPNPTARNAVKLSLEQAKKRFRKRYPDLTDWHDPNFRLCTAQQLFLAQILIDATMQRKLNIAWVLEIVSNFNAWQARPVSVYRIHDPENVKYTGQEEWYASWDGQHTTGAEWVIACEILGLDPAQVKIPVVFYDVRSKAEIREMFVKGNTSEGQKFLDRIDIWEQMIYGVRIDGSDNLDWLNAEQKQQYLENAGLFLTDNKFNDHHEPGAITRVQDIADKKVSAEIVRQFCVYAEQVLSFQERAINTKEAPIILGFLRMAEAGDVKYTDNELKSLADYCTMTFGADFDEAGPFWAQLEISYRNWWERYYENVEESLRPERARMNKDWIQGGTFFYYQLKKGWYDDNGDPIQLPRLNIGTSFRPDEEDLF